MKKLLLILGFALGLANVTYAKQAPLHPDPYKIMTQGKILHSDYWSSHGQFFYEIAYKGTLYQCRSKEREYYYCRALSPLTE